MQKIEGCSNYINNVLIFDVYPKDFNICKLSGYKIFRIRIFPHATVITFAKSSIELNQTDTQYI